jgi:hypothetical protein
MAMRAKGALLILLAAVARAGDPPAPDPITTAKKDFATIKSLSSPADPASVLPSMDLKDLGPSPGAHVDSPAPLPDTEAVLDPTKKKEKEGTGNWLVDAMDKKSDRPTTSRGRDDGLKSDPDLLRDADRSGAPAERDPQASAEAGEKGDRAAAAPAINPLDSFMAGWISAHDHDLLLPVAKSGGAQAPDAGTAQAESVAGLDPGPGGISDSLLPSPEGARWADSRPDSNPFIAALDFDPAPPIRLLAAPDASGFAPTGLQNGGSGPGVDPRPADASRTFIPDFAQPSDDDKYFRQMKKF